MDEHTNLVTLTEEQARALAECLRPLCDKDTTEEAARKRVDAKHALRQKLTRLDDLRRCETRIFEERKAREDAEARAHHYAERMDKFRDGCNKWRDKAEKFEHRVQAYAEQTEGFRKARDEFEAEVRRLKAENSELRNSYRIAVDDRHLEVSGLKTALNEERGRVEILRGELRMSERAIKDRIDEREKLTAQCNDANERRIYWCNRAKAAEQERDEFSAKYEKADAGARIASIAAQKERERLQRLLDGKHDTPCACEVCAAHREDLEEKVAELTRCCEVLENDECEDPCECACCSNAREELEDKLRKAGSRLSDITYNLNEVIGAIDEIDCST